MPWINTSFYKSDIISNCNNVIKSNNQKIDPNPTLPRRIEIFGPGVVSEINFPNERVNVVLQPGTIVEKFITTVGSVRAVGSTILGHIVAAKSIMLDKTDCHGDVATGTSIYAKNCSFVNIKSEKSTKLFACRVTGSVFARTNLFLYGSTIRKDVFLGGHIRKLTQSVIEGRICNFSSITEGKLEPKWLGKDWFCFQRTPHPENACVRLAEKRPPKTREDPEYRRTYPQNAYVRQA